jgi:hypothetical protein
MSTMGNLHSLENELKCEDYPEDLYLWCADLFDAEPLLSKDFIMFDFKKGVSPDLLVLSIISMPVFILSFIK